MKFSPSELLALVQGQASDVAFENLYLWPRTPIGDEIQTKIRERVGADDLDASLPHSRPFRILRHMQRLCLPAEFSVLDIACGDALILTHIKRQFPTATCYGLDCNVGRFPQHEHARRQGVQLYRGFLQHLVEHEATPPFDVILMLNTYRSWESADLREHERDLPARMDSWLDRNGCYIYLTATRQQAKEWRHRAYRIVKLGRGEDKSMLICLSKNKLPG